MPRRQTRVTNRALELAGVDATPGPDVSDDIQLTYILGDLSPLMSPLPIRSFWSASSQVAQAGEQSGFDIRPPPDSAIFIHYVENQSGQACHFGYGAQLNGTIGVAIVPDAQDPAGSVSRSGIRRATNWGLIPGVALAAGAVAPANLFPLRVSPGNFFRVCGDVVNTQMLWIVIWQEVPPTPAAL